MFLALGEFGEVFEFWEIDSDFFGDILGDDLGLFVDDVVSARLADAFDALDNAFVFELSADETDGLG